MLLSAVILHLLWGIALLMSPVALVTTPMAISISVFGQHGAGIALLIAAALSAVSLSQPGWRGLFLGIFQNCMLWLSAASAAVAVVMSSYPDGTLRPWWFIFTDQLPVILFAVLHTVSLALYHSVGADR